MEVGGRPSLCLAADAGVLRFDPQRSSALDRRPQRSSALDQRLRPRRRRLRRPSPRLRPCSIPCMSLTISPIIVGLRIPALIPPRSPTAPYRDPDEGKAAAAVLSMILLVCIFKMDSGWMDLEFGGGGLDWIG